MKKASRKIILPLIIIFVVSIIAKKIVVGPLKTKHTEMTDQYNSLVSSEDIIKGAIDVKNPGDSGINYNRVTKDNNKLSSTINVLFDGEGYQNIRSSALKKNILSEKVSKFLFPEQGAYLTGISDVNMITDMSFTLNELYTLNIEGNFYNYLVEGTLNTSVDGINIDQKPIIMIASVSSKDDVEIKEVYLRK